MSVLDKTENTSSQNDLLYRDTIFISHANPEDNDFAIWLASQLNNAGYSVWLDENKFKGGNTMWDVIESFIETKTVKFIAILSENSHKEGKDGVKNEIACAIETEKRNNYEDFILPVWLQKIKLPIELKRKYCIDFTKNWADGLIHVIEFLEEHKIPKQTECNPVLFNWREIIYNNLDMPVEEKELLQSNWYQINSLPKNLYFYNIRCQNPEIKLKDIVDDNEFPARFFENRVCSFFGISELKKCLPSNFDLEFCSYKTTDNFLAGSPELKYKDARNIVVSLISKSWNYFMKTKGLISHELSSKTIAWWVPNGLIPENKVKFIKPDGKNGRRVLVGYSEKKGVYWHFAVSIKPSLAEINKICLKTHVFFSIDGKELLPDDTKQHRLRRGFCKSWFNAKWRDLLYGFMCWISNTEEINIPLESASPIIISGFPIMMECPISVKNVETGVEETDIDEETDTEQEIDPAFMSFEDDEDEDFCEELNND